MRCGRRRRDEPYGGLEGWAAYPPELVPLLAASRAPASAQELAGESAAVAALRHATRHRVLRRAGATGVLTTAVLGSALTAVAYAGLLPAPVQHAASRALQAVGLPHRHTTAPLATASAVTPLRVRAAAPVHALPPRPHRNATSATTPARAAAPLRVSPSHRRPPHLLPEPVAARLRMSVHVSLHAASGPARAQLTIHITGRPRVAGRLTVTRGKRQVLSVTVTRADHTWAMPLASRKTIVTITYAPVGGGPVIRVNVTFAAAPPARRTCTTRSTTARSGHRPCKSGTPRRGHSRGPQPMADPVTPPRAQPPRTPPGTHDRHKVTDRHRRSL